MSKKKVSPLGDSWKEYEETFLSAEEKAEVDLRAAIVSELIKARKERGLTQKELEALSNVSQPVIARLEAGATDPQLSTLVRLFQPLGLRLAIVKEGTGE